MENKILICYASGSGSTREIAEFIGDELSNPDVTVVVSAAKDVTEIDDYSAVILGSSIRFGKWLDPAIAFLDKYADDLIDIPIALFMTCLTIVEGSANMVENALSYWDPILHQIPGNEPIGLGLFAGSLAPEFGQLILYKDGPYGDYRDWDVISAWVLEIRDALFEGAPKPTSPSVLAGTVLSYDDLSGYNLERFNFQNLERVILRGTKLKGADFRRANLHAADLRGANLNQARLGWVDLRDANCSEADFSYANLIGGNLEKAVMEAADLSHTVLNGALMGGANLRRANFQSSDMNWVDLRGSDLSGANLKKANLGWANLSDATLTDANFEGARYNAHTKWPEDFAPNESGCILIEGLLL